MFSRIPSPLMYMFTPLVRLHTNYIFQQGYFTHAIYHYKDTMQEESNCSHILQNLKHKYILLMHSDTVLMLTPAVLNEM